ncbi:MAG TPA: Fic family protein [Candidatus Baltobacteraceae bacterium]|nr:Fic family protein [Candidatus Baltobacteraceae bacterium]
MADAELAIARLDQSASALADTEALARLLLRAESVSSSKIEGLEVGARRLLRADIARVRNEDPHDVTAAEVLGNVDAMHYALEAVDRSSEITRDLLLDVHRRLMQPTSLHHLGGVVRTTQNWIGGSSHNPCSAAFVPPPPQYVDELLADLCAFCNSDSTPAVMQAAIAHAQFETIHPFADGNGRVGRALVHMIFRRRGLTTVITPPVSLVLATMADDYVAGLTATRYVGNATSAPALEGLNRWIATFSSACTRSVNDAVAYEQRIATLQAQWRERIGHVRSDSAVFRLMRALPGSPVVTAASVVKLIRCSLPAAISALERLAKANILSALSDRKRRQVFEAREVIATFTALERQLASPAGNTTIAKRRAPGSAGA